MITAKQAHHIANENQDSNQDLSNQLIDKQKNDLNNLIQKAARKGYYSIYYQELLYPQVKSDLEAAGYKFQESYEKTIVESVKIKVYIGVNISW